MGKIFQAIHIYRGGGWLDVSNNIQNIQNWYYLCNFIIQSQNKSIFKTIQNCTKYNTLKKRENFYEKRRTDHVMIDLIANHEQTFFLFFSLDIPFDSWHYLSLSTYRPDYMACSVLSSRGLQWHILSRIIATYYIKFKILSRRLHPRVSVLHQSVILQNLVKLSTSK